MNIIQILGPTGVGKTGISVKIAKRFNGEIISADSVQVYKGFDIGSSKISEEEKKGVKHYLLDILEPDKRFSVKDFIDISFKFVTEITERGRVPIVCGGTALYLRSMIKGIFRESEIKKISRDKIKTIGDKRGYEYLWTRLNKIDSKYAEKIGRNDKLRIVRGLEIYYNNGIIPSDIRKITDSPFSKYKFIRIGLLLPRDEMYKRINDRVDLMIKKGLQDEVKKLRNFYDMSFSPMNSIGYKEMNMYFDGKYSFDEAVKLIKQHSRNFAKRQMTWFRNENDIKWFNPKEHEAICEYIKNKTYE